MTRYDSADGLSGLSPNLPPQMTMAPPALSSRVPEEEPVRGRRCVFAGFFQQMAWAAAGATSASLRPVSPPSSHAASPSRRFGTPVRYKAEDGQERPSYRSFSGQLCPQVPGAPLPGSKRRELVSVPRVGANSWQGSGLLLQLHCAAAPNSSRRSAQGFAGAGTVLLLQARQGAGTRSIPTRSGCPPRAACPSLCCSVLPGRTMPAAQPTPVQKPTRTNPTCTTSTGTIVG